MPSHRERELLPFCWQQYLTKSTHRRRITSPDTDTTPFPRNSRTWPFTIRGTRYVPLCTAAFCLSTFRVLRVTSCVWCMLMSCIPACFFVFSGPRATIHACTLSDGCLIGAGATILDGAVVSEGAVVAPGATVTANTVIPQGQVRVGATLCVLR